ncbi:hypothetical protein NON20_26225 (plasmid) [Synechocystis sp. B12]|nr:hypothetical protein NON20_26225 [Synechocystis sp. B12]
MLSGVKDVAEVSKPVQGGRRSADESVQEVKKEKKKNYPPHHPDSVQEASPKSVNPVQKKKSRRLQI